MQFLIYVLVALVAVAIGIAAQQLLAFSIIEAVLLGLVLLSLGLLVVEHVLRRRAEARLGRGVEELSKLVGTVAQAGAVLGQRINSIAEINADNRLEGAEADISVLGTVIRQVAEAVADIEKRTGSVPATGDLRREVADVVEPPAEPVVPLDELRDALADDRVVFYAEPIVTLPQRRPHGYDLVPLLEREDGERVPRGEFMPTADGDEEIRQIEAGALAEAAAIARRARSSGHPTNIFVPLSRATLNDVIASEQLLAVLDSNRAVAASLTFVIPDMDWRFSTIEGRALIDQIAKKGASFSLSGVRNLRVDVNELFDRGVRSVRVDVVRFLENPEDLIDFHASDVASFLSRSGVTLLVTGIANEGQILELLDDGVTLVQGPHIGKPDAIRTDLMVDRPRQVEAAPQAAGV